MTKFFMHSMNQNTTDAMNAPANRPAFRMSCTNGAFCAASMIMIILGSAILAESILFALALVLGLLLAVLALLVLVSVRISPPRSANRYMLASAA